MPVASHFTSLKSVFPLDRAPVNVSPSPMYLGFAPPCCSPHIRCPLFLLATYRLPNLLVSGVEMRRISLAR